MVGHLWYSPSQHFLNDWDDGIGICSLILPIKTTGGMACVLESQSWPVLKKEEMVD